MTRTFSRRLRVGVGGVVRNAYDTLVEKQLSFYQVFMASTTIVPALSIVLPDPLNTTAPQRSQDTPT